MYWNKVKVFIIINSLSLTEGVHLVQVEEWVHLEGLEVDGDGVGEEEDGTVEEKALEEG